MVLRQGTCGNAGSARKCNAGGMAQRDEANEARRIYRTSHPGMSDWGLQATAKMTGIPASIGAQLLARGEVQGCGVMAPEDAFAPTRFIAELARRGIRVEERIEECGVIDVRSADAPSQGQMHS